jgi:alpha-1,3-glucosyltransferase
MPSLIYVDHGHFQPNSAMHGFVLWAIYFALTNRLSYALIFMVLAVNFKQNALYFALPFAAYTLSILWKSTQVRYKGDRMKQIVYVFGRCLVLGVVFVIFNVILWWPWVKESLGGDPKHGIDSVLTRLFPVRRGLFEDKVASFWCVINNFVKVHQVLSPSVQI